LPLARDNLRMVRQFAIGATTARLESQWVRLRPAVAQALPPMRGMKRKSKRILVIDDNPVVLTVLQDFLTAAYTVDTATSASQALALVLSRPPDVILLDIKMPGTDGLSLLKSFRTMGLETPVFMMTGYDSTEVALDAFGNGANGYLPKPFDLLHLERLIADALGAEPAFAN
jgi:CheY-like chemotaxis protein